METRNQVWKAFTHSYSCFQSESNVTDYGTYFRTDSAVRRIDYLIDPSTFGVSRNQKTIIPYTTISCFTNSKIQKLKQNNAN